MNSVDFLDWGNWDGDLYAIEAFDNGISKGKRTFVANTDFDYVVLDHSSILTSVFDNIDEVRIYLDSESINTFIGINNIVIDDPIVPDTTAPIISNIETNSITQNIATISSMSNEDASIYYVITNSLTAPTSLQVLEGEDFNGLPTNWSGVGIATAAVAKEFYITNLAANTQYFVYFVAKDNSKNISDVYSTSFKTLINTYTVTFKDWDNTTLKTEIVNHGSNATAPASPTRSGYTFRGWDTALTNVTTNVTITAQYDANAYKVSFDSDGGSMVGAIAGDYGTVITAPPAPTKIGYKFDGWYKESGLTNVWNFGVDTVPVNGTTLYAKWTINTYTVTFKDWDNTTLKTEIVNHGSNATAPASPTRSGYTFRGWDTALTNVTTNVTITAQYDVNAYTVSFDSDGGSVVGAIAGDYGTVITAPPAPTKIGYKFDGWYKESGLTNVWNFGVDTVPVNGTTLYANWTINTYTVTFKDWG